MKKCIGYTRVSTAGQAIDGVSIDAQAEKIKAWAILNGYELVGIYSDAGMSGKRADNRPGLQSALDAATKQGAPVVVYSLSRLARSTKDAIIIAERLGKAGADLVSLSENIDTISAAGKMVFRMLAVLAEFERDCTAERTKTALQFKKSKGERVGTVPFGFDLAADGVSLTENTDEQSVIAKIHQMRDQGLSTRAIAAELTAQGIRTKSGKTTWAHTTVAKLVA